MNYTMATADITWQKQRNPGFETFGTDVKRPVKNCECPSESRGKDRGRSPVSDGHRIKGSAPEHTADAAAVPPAPSPSAGAVSSSHSKDNIMHSTALHIVSNRHKNSLNIDRIHVSMITVWESPAGIVLAAVLPVER